MAISSDRKINVYGREELLLIGKDVIGSSITYRVPFSTWKTIADLGLEVMRKTQRGSRGGKARTETLSTQQDPPKSQKLSMCVANCRSVRSKSEYLNDFISEHDLDCFALTETWLSNNEADNDVVLSSLVPNKYKIIHFPRQTDQQGGGVGFIYKDHYKVKVDNHYTAESFESMCVLMDSGSHTFRIMIIYRLIPTQENKLKRAQFLKELAGYLELSVTLSGKLLLVGDFNVHWDCPENSEKLELESLIDSFNLVQHVEGPTHKENHTLDLVISRDEDDIVSSCTVRDYVSDHNALFVELNCCKKHPERKTITYRNMKSLDSSALQADIEKAFTEIHTKTLDEMVNTYHTKLGELLDSHAPHKKRCVVEHDNPWINEDILSAKREKRKAEKQWRKSRLAVHKELYKDMCVQVKEAVKKAKAEYYLKTVNDCEGDQKKLYKVVNSLLGREKPKMLPSASSDGDLAEQFNSFFTSKIDTIRHRLQELEVTTNDLTIHDLETLLKKGTTITEFMQTNPEEVKEIIKEASNATCSLDPIPTSLVNVLLPSLAAIIAEIVNKSLSTGTFPSMLKSALVKPLLKKQTLDCEIFKNYRPVSNLSFLSKVIEKVVARRLLDHMKENDLLDEFQSAYRAAHSTETALLRVHNDIMRSVDTGMGVLLILLDLSAAFDTVDHDYLVSFLQKYVGLNGSALNLFQSYLSGRTQQVMINDILSELTTLVYGVPQGSVLGPLLFCIYTLPVGTILRHHGLHYHIYADDTQVYCAVNLKDHQTGIDKVSKCVSDIRTWMINNKLKINDDKTEFLFIKSPRKDTGSDLEIKVGDEMIKPSNDCRNLGVMFQSDMSMEIHIKNICKSALFQLRNISKIRMMLTNTATAQLVHALVATKLDYCNSLLYGIHENKLQRLQRVQNVAARIVARCPKSDHISPVRQDLHWLPIKERIVFKILLIMYKCVNNMAPTYLSEFIVEKDYNMQTRSMTNEELQVPKTNLKSFGDRAFSVCGPLEWNRLPVDIRHASSVDTFKRRIKTWLFQSAY